MSTSGEKSVERVAQAAPRSSALLTFFFLCTATIPASFGLLQDGFFSSSDGMIHLYRLFELDRSLHAGILYPRWFPLSGYGYGLPVLNYYPPLAYYLAEFFHLFGAGYIVSIKLLVASTFVLASISMFLFARELLGVAPAIVASIAFVYLPYLLSDAYIRGNFAELLALALIPLALFALRRLYAIRKPGFLFLAAVAFAAIVLSHHLTAMLVAPLIAAYVLFLFVLKRNWRGLLACAGALFAGLALSAFYWVPAIAELNLVFVGPASVPRFLVSRLVSAADFFSPSLVYSYLPQSQALLHSAGFPQTITALLVGAFIITLGVARRLVASRGGKTPKRESTTSLLGRMRAEPSERAQKDARSVWAHSGLFFFVLILSIFMMLDISAPLWYAVPTLRFLQFPWRAQVLAGVSIAFLIGAGARQIQRITNYQLQRISYALLSLALIALAAADLPIRAFPLTDAQLDLRRSDDSDYVVAQMGWGWTREFVPASVQEETVIGQKARLGSAETQSAIPSVRIERDDLFSSAMVVSALRPSALSIHTFFYPGWLANVDNVPVNMYPNGDLGLATVDVPPGDHRVTFQFGETPFRAAMDLVSALTLAVGVVWLGVARRRALVVPAIAAILLIAVFFLHARAASAMPKPVALDANFENRALLIGYSTERSDDAAYVTLYWLALSEMDRDYTSFVHLVGSNGDAVVQHDSITDQGLTPTTRWQAGEIVTDHHALELKGVPSGQYHLIAGMYLPLAGGYVNLTASDRAGNKIGNQVELGRFELGQ